MTNNSYRQLVGDVIAARVDRGWTMTTLSNEAGISTTTLSALERGLSATREWPYPERDTVYKLCKTLGLHHLDYLMPVDTPDGHSS